VSVNDNLHFPRIRRKAFIRYKQVSDFHKQNACGEPVANAVACVRFDLLLCISRAHSQLVQLNRSLRNVISFPTNFRARHFKSIVVLRYATSNLPRRRFLLDFVFFRDTMRRSARRCEWTNALAGREKKDQREIRIVHVNVNKRESTGISLKGVLMCLSEMWQKNESLYDMHRRKCSTFFDFRQSSSKTNASFVKDSEWNSKIKNVAKMTMKSSRNP